MSEYHRKIAADLNSVLGPTLSAACIEAGSQTHTRDIETGDLEPDASQKVRLLAFYVIVEALRNAAMNGVETDHPIDDLVRQQLIAPGNEGSIVDALIEGELKLAFTRAEFVLGKDR